MFMLKRIVRSIVSREEVELKLVEVVKRYVPGEVDLKASYKALGLNELDTIEIIAMVESDLGADLDTFEVMLIEDLPATVNMMLKNINEPESRRKKDPSKFIP